MQSSGKMKMAEVFSNPLPAQSAAAPGPVCTTHQMARELGVPYAETLATIRDYVMQLTPDHMGCRYKEIFDTGATDCLRMLEEMERGSSQPSGARSKPSTSSSATSTNHASLPTETANKSNSCATRPTRDTQPQAVRKTTVTSKIEFSPWEICKLPHAATSSGCPIVLVCPPQQTNITQSKTDAKTDATRQTSSTDAPRKTSTTDTPKALQTSSTRSSTPPQTSSTNNPRQTLSTKDPRQSSSTKDPRPTPLTNTPRHTQSTRDARQTLSTKDGRKTPSTNIPRQTSSTNDPRQTSSTNIPRQISSTNDPQQTSAIIDTYGQIAPTNTPRQTSSTNVHRQSSTNISRQTSSTNNSRQTPSTNIPRQASSTNTPCQTSSTNAVQQVSSTNTAQKTSSTNRSSPWPSSDAFSTVMRSRSSLRDQNEKSDIRCGSNMSVEFSPNAESKCIEKMAQTQKNSPDEMGTNLKGTFDYIQEYRQSYTYNKLVEYMDTTEPLTQQQSAPALIGANPNTRRPLSGGRGKSRVQRGRVNVVLTDREPIEPLIAKRITLIPPHGTPVKEENTQRKTRTDRNIHSAERKYESLTLTVVNFNQFKDGLRPKKH